MASNWERVKEELTCAICQDLLNDPKILPCLHSFCTSCLKEWSERLANLDPSKRHLECPLCRAKVLLSTSHDIEKLPSHFSAIRLIEIVRLQELANITKTTPICQNCNEGENAVSSCSECAIFLCDFCEKAHQRFKATSEHKVCSLDELRKSTSEPEVPAILPQKVEMCHTHPTKPLELYCKCEEVLICRDCIIKKHKDHDYDVISDVVEKEKKILQDVLPGIHQLVYEVENAVTKIKDRRKDVRNGEEESLQNLDNAFNAFHEALHKQKQQLREQVIKDTQEKDKVLQVQESELSFLLSQLKSCHSFIDDKVQRGVNQDVLAMKRSMLKRRDKLTEAKNGSVLYPLIPNQLPGNLDQTVTDKMFEIISQLK